MSLRIESILQAMPPRAQGARLIVAYSGGIDSTALLYLFAQAGVAQLHAAHVHHGLQATADEWAARCADQAAALGVPFSALHVSVAADHPAGPEAAAREARYAALRGLMQPGDVLVTAHHLDDQAETVLLRLLRGSGVQGLAAMRGLETFEPGLLWRPLLQTSRAQLQEYAQAHELKWIDDPHNSDDRYARSWLRKQIMPLLQQRWPAAADSFARSAALAAEAADLLEEVAAADCAAANAGQGLSITALQRLSPARRMQALRWWLARIDGLSPVPYKTLVRIEPELIDARVDAEPLLAWPGGELRRYRDRLYAMPPLSPLPPDVALAWNGCGTLDLPAGCGRLVTENSLPQSGLLVRFAGGGERFQPAGSRHSRTLKNLFQESGVPPWQRPRTPLLLRDGLLAWVGRIGWAANQQDSFGIRWQTPAHIEDSPK